MKEIYELQADVCKVFSNAKRMEIINILKDGEASANGLIERTGLSKANLSQHMSILKAKGVILTRREGVNMYYRITNPKIIQACNLMREVLAEQIQEKGRIVSIIIGAPNKSPARAENKEESS
ncbi:MAG: metalloregulator ArsR/SmtB family transcription factor [Deltaproteobacteria bacterium]|nr:metalloregulator ArsR/SmtB family transcription factor [Deltaproteobacteria bacterium]